MSAHVNKHHGHAQIFREEGSDERFLCARCLKDWPGRDVVQLVPGDDYYTFWLCRGCLRELSETGKVEIVEAPRPEDVRAAGFDFSVMASEKHTAACAYVTASGSPHISACDCGQYAEAIRKWNARYCRHCGQTEQNHVDGVGAARDCKYEEVIAT